MNQAGWTFNIGNSVPADAAFITSATISLNAGTIADYQPACCRLAVPSLHTKGRDRIGLAIADISHWNRTYRVHEFHTAPTHQRRGVGRQLIAALEARGRAAGLRTLLCETQNTNVPAIHFYQKMGFSLEGLELSHYRNADYPDGEIGVLLKKPLGPGRAERQVNRGTRIRLPRRSSGR